MAGLRFGAVAWWPGPIHEGNGAWLPITDEQATKDQREALIALHSGQHGGTYFEIFAAVCPNRIEPRFAPMVFNVDREKRRATIRIPNLIETDVEPINNPATGEAELRLALVGHRRRTQGPNRVAQLASNTKKPRWVTQ